jgi:ubiquinone/menaquinone biosynthesis C-methylase UbiE
MTSSDQKTTVNQFTLQASGYARSATIRNDEVLSRITTLAELSDDDVTLDVACGPGLVVCAFAPKVLRATGIDITHAMLEQARRLQVERGLQNVTWAEGDVRRLPYADATFTVVTCRYAFHHFADPAAVLSEMRRVMRPGGTIMVVDSSPAREKAEGFNKMEKLRDPSHVRALTEKEWRELFGAASVALSHVETFRLAGDLDSLLSRSFPLEGDEKLIRAMFETALESDFLDVQPRKDGANITYGFPIAILKGKKAE